MKVLVFPALLAIAIITGPAKSGNSPATPTVLAKQSTTTAASLKQEQAALPSPVNSAPATMAPLGTR